MVRTNGFRLDAKHTFVVRAAPGEEGVVPVAEEVAGREGGGGGGTATAAVAQAPQKEKVQAEADARAASSSSDDDDASA